MAQADSVRNSTRQLITGGSAIPSTNLPAVTVGPSDRGYFIGSLGRRCPMGEDKAALPLRHCCKRAGGIQPDGLFNRRWYLASTGHVPTGSNIEALFYAWWLLRNILLVARRFLNRNKRLHFRARENAVDKVSSNQLVLLNPQERLK